VKKVNTTLCKSACTQVFTWWHGMSLAGREISETKFRKQQRENYKNGRERPHFFGFQPPKKFVGSLPPSGTGFGAGSFPS